MEDIIQEGLEKLYKIPISVKFIDFRLYEIYLEINHNKICFPILYDNRLTNEINIHNIRDKINKEIINLYMKEV